MNNKIFIIMTTKQFILVNFICVILSGVNAQNSVSISQVHYNTDVCKLSQLANLKPDTLYMSWDNDIILSKTILYDGIDYAYKPSEEDTIYILPEGGTSNTKFEKMTHADNPSYSLKYLPKQKFIAGVQTTKAKLMLSGVEKQKYVVYISNIQCPQMLTQKFALSSITGNLIFAVYKKNKCIINTIYFNTEKHFSTEIKTSCKNHVITSAKIDNEIQ